MKILIPLWLLILSVCSMAQVATWSSMTKVDDEIRLKAGELALVVAVSQPVYLDIKDARRDTVGIRLRPSVPRQFRGNFYRPDSYAERGTQSVDWRNPFPISGPCQIRLGTTAIVTLRIISPKG